MGDIADLLRGDERASPSRSGATAAKGAKEAPRAAAAAARRQVAIPTTRDPRWESRSVWVTQTGHVAESFRQLALSVRAALEEAKASSLLVTSAMPGEGKTFTACNLALALESLEPGGQVALVEFDLRRPAMASVFGLDAAPGMESVLAGEQPLAATAVRTDAALDLYPVGHHVRDVHRLLASDLLYTLLDELEQRYQVVVCDSPPALLVPDVKLLARRVGGVLAVARARRTPKSAFQALSDFLPRDKLLGCFLNDALPSRRDRYYASNYYEPPEGTVGDSEGDAR